MHSAAQLAVAEVRIAVGVLSVCRRVRNALLTERLPLTLDFSFAPLSKAQCEWLAADIRVGRVVYVSFHHSDTWLWKEGARNRFLARHGASQQDFFAEVKPLRRLSLVHG